MTKHHAPIATYSKAASRPNTFASINHDVTGGPGQYDSPKKFGEEIPGFTIGRKRNGKYSDTPGPGTYEPERAETVTKASPKKSVFEKSPSRPKNFAPRGHDVTSGPGQYTDNKKFGDDTKVFSFGARREPRRDDSPGPGTYSPERSENATKHKAPIAAYAKSPSRP